MERLETVLEYIDSLLWGSWLLIVLLGVGLLYTIISGGVQIRYFPYIIKKTIWDPIINKEEEEAEHGSISSFQALCTAIASCVGSGNIVGVSTAVLTGGMGALFWMWFAAFLGMATKFGEIVLGMLYREKNAHGDYVGGPMYYIEKGLKLKPLAYIASALMVIQIIGGNFIQSNTISGVVNSSFGIPRIITGIFLVVLIFTISVGGLKRLAHVAQRIVPFMAVLYIAGGLLIILINIKMVPEVIADIFAGAFNIQAVGGGMAGTAMMLAMKKGVARGLYSNEAGEGSGPVIHSSAKVNHPVEQGINGVTEVFVDTFVICSITGLVIGVSGVIDSGLTGDVLVMHAFGQVWDPLRYFITICLLLFSSTTLMSQWYFGYVGLNYIFGMKVADKFKYVFPLFCIVGALLKIEVVWTIQDIALGLLILPNLTAMLFLFPEVKESTKDYFKHYLNKKV